MSLEQALAENTAALNGLLAALTSSAGRVIGSVDVAEPVKAVAKPKAEIVKKAAEDTAKEDAKPKTLGEKFAASAAAKEAANASPSSEVLLTEAKNLTLELVKADTGIGRDATVALLAKYGAKKAPEIKPEQLAAYIAEGKELLAAKNAVEDDLA